MRAWNVVWSLVRFAAFVALALHLGWSWWLVLLLIVAVIELTFE